MPNAAATSAYLTGGELGASTSIRGWPSPSSSKSTTSAGGWGIPAAFAIAAAAASHSARSCCMSARGATPSTSAIATTTGF